MNNQKTAPLDAPPSGPRTPSELGQTGGLRQVTLTAAPRGSESAGRASSSNELDPYLGATIDGRYLVEKVLGEGGMGVVYRCRHTIIDKLVAMKVLRADMARNEEVTERFLNEARSASSIGNPHIIDISDFGRLPDGATYFIMEFLDGVPLAGLLDEQKALSQERILKIAVQLAEGLAAAHEGGIVHRDLKPDNIFLLRRGTQADFVKILDFGIAKASTTNSKLTQAGQVFGTPHYMSPEQAAGSPVDHRSDIYSLGVILYEMASGRLPFDAENFMAILTQHMYKTAPALSELTGLLHPISSDLEAVIAKCMEKAPEDRYASMTELADDLHRLRTGDRPDAARSHSRVPGAVVDAGKTRPASKGRGTLLGLAALAFVVASGAVWFVATESSTSARAAAVAASASSAPASASATPAATTQLAPSSNPSAVPGPKTVALAASPLDAHVFKGSEDLGESPLVLEIGDQPLDLEVRKDGYDTKRLVLDGSDEKVTVTLVKSPVAKATVAKAASHPAPAPSPAKAPASTKPKSGGGLIDNPWE